MPLFPEPPSDAEYNISRIPLSWRVLHILLCFTGVNNVFLIKPLPRCLRVASLVYHAAWFCLSFPVVIVFIHNIQWEQSVANVIEHVGMIIYSSYLLTLGTAHGINALKANRIVKFLKKWCLFRFGETLCHKVENKKRYKIIRIVLLIVYTTLTTWYMVAVVRYFIIFDWYICGPTLFPSLSSKPHWLLKAVCMIYHLITYLSASSVILTACHFALVTLTLAEEFDTLYRVICNHVVSPSTDISAWEHVRFRHEALVSLVCLHGQMSSMSLGFLLVGNVVFLCFNLYYFLIVHPAVMGALSLTLAFAVLSTIIAPSNILENEVSKICLYTLMCDQNNSLDFVTKKTWHFIVKATGIVDFSEQLGTFESPVPRVTWTFAYTTLLSQMVSTHATNVGAQLFLLDAALG